MSSYRYAFRLNTPSAFKSPLSQAVLTAPGIGRHSPTMARRKDKRRISREQLAMNVRRNFNASAVKEEEVIVRFVSKTKWQGLSSFALQRQACLRDFQSLTWLKDREFRIRFAVSRNR